MEITGRENYHDTTVLLWTLATVVHKVLGGDETLSIRQLSNHLRNMEEGWGPTEDDDSSGDDEALTPLGSQDGHSDDDDDEDG